jgi:hypothetical protein
MKEPLIQVSDIPEGGTVTADLLGREMLVMFLNGKPRAYLNVCVHHGGERSFIHSSPPSNRGEVEPCATSIKSPGCSESNTALRLRSNPVRRSRYRQHSSSLGNRDLLVRIDERHRRHRCRPRSPFAFDVQRCAVCGHINGDPGVANVSGEAR